MAATRTPRRLTRDARRERLISGHGADRGVAIRDLIVLLTAVAAVLFTATASAATYKRPPVGQDQWYWQIGGGALPSRSAPYPAPGSANVWDTDDYADASSLGANHEPSGRSAIVASLHAAGKYSICYIEAGAEQPEPDSSDFAAADYRNGRAATTRMQGYPDEYWYDLRGFAGFKYGESDKVLTGAAPNIAAGLAHRIEGCAAEGQDALEPDDLDGYTNRSASGAAGGGWGMTKADAAGFAAWLATAAHADGLAVFQKNDGANARVDQPHFEGMIIEECNYYKDPCSGSGGDATAYLRAGKPVLNAEYTEDGETTAKFCGADIAAGITGALFNVDLNGATYEPCEPVGAVRAGGTGGKGTGRGRSDGRPENTNAPTLRGSARQGDRLKVSNGSWSGSPTRYSYAWKRCAAGCRTVRGATRRTYSLGAHDVGYRLVAVVRALNARGSASAASHRSSPVRRRRR